MTRPTSPLSSDAPPRDLPTSPPVPAVAGTGALSRRPFRRSEMLAALGERRTWDVLVVGGGATGLGIAVDAATRGYATALVEQDDFAKGTSSRSTKLVHGGVRYLQQGNVALVMGALRERGLLRRNAPHLVHDLPFVVPSYRWWETPFYGVGMKVYDMLAGRYGFGRSRILSRDEVLARIPNIEDDELRGGTLYHDGQFDDARLALALARTAVDHGAILLNRARVSRLIKEQDRVVGAVVEEGVGGGELELRAHAVVNATGPFVDELRRMDDPATPPMIASSQGVHIVLDRAFLAGESAIMVPHTRDGRVMFAIPWHHVVVVGTTDTPIDRAEREPRAHPGEIDFILETANRYLERPASHRDILSVFCGVRPLVSSGHPGSTASLSRDHVIHIDQTSGLCTIAGGKWTTYRHMAEDLVDHVALLADLPPAVSRTAELPLHGAPEEPNPTLGLDSTPQGHDPLAVHGTEAAALRALAAEDPRLGATIHPRLPTIAAEIVWAVREEMALSVEDVLSRRTRCLLYDAAAAVEAASGVARLMADHLDAAVVGTDRERWIAGQIEAFTALARGYLGPSGSSER
ncbi:MAG TPA: glycerol-3-phosphate dehydrogenase/oxidase [Phycisphaerales bacterium]|nr:glycerol-3-phosphate dehydrogenase/oxidase [Phycisphaerales bacterium]HMP38624.1 glycerol-3-phosphate dehydrogenase/oxidase [Phycisphaerales bacterium]